jgi:hypothetical protein
VRAENGSRPVRGRGRQLPRQPCPHAGLQRDPKTAGEVEAVQVLADAPRHVLPAPARDVRVSQGPAGGGLVVRLASGTWRLRRRRNLGIVHASPRIGGRCPRTFGVRAARSRTRSRRAHFGDRERPDRLRRERSAPRRVAAGSWLGTASLMRNDALGHQAVGSGGSRSRRPRSRERVQSPVAKHARMSPWAKHASRRMGLASPWAR